MLSFASPAILLLLLPAIAFTVWLWANGYLNLGARRRFGAGAARVTLLTLVIVALAGPSVRVSQGHQAVVFIADLSASNAVNRTEMQSFIDGAVAHRPTDGIAGVVTVGRNALVELPVSSLQHFDGFQSQVHPDATNLERGLELANAIIPDGYRRRIIVLSDGQQNQGNALAAAHILHQQGVRVDVVPEHVGGGADVRVDSVTLPSQLHTHERFVVTVGLASNVSTPVRIDLYRDGALLLSRATRVQPGMMSVHFDQGPLPGGPHRYQVRINPRIDSIPQNNSGSASTTVQSAPRVLVVAGSRSRAATIVSALRTTGLNVDLRSPDEVVPTLEYLQNYAGTIIVDTAAPVLGSTLLGQLVPYVRDLGRGLVVIGGEESYSLGAYGQTPLEQVLPVRMDLPKKRDVPSTAVVLMIESLEAASPVNISKEAGKAVVKLLTEQDRVGVNDTPNDTTPGWVVPLQPVRDKRVVDSAINTMQPGDPNSYAGALLAAYDSLRRVDARIKHILLLGDGDATDSRYATIVKKIHSAGITLSTVVTNPGGPGDIQNMRNLAHWGGGRYYRADDPKSIPSIFLREARSIARSGIVSGKFYPKRLSSSPMLRDLSHLPPLNGYVATTAKPSAELDLVSKKLDPILAGWQFGLGRSVAWTSDAAGLWSRDWLASPQANRFWADVVDWTLPAGGNNHLFVSATARQGQGQIVVDTPASLGAGPSITARVVDPALHGATVQLQPWTPGEYRANFDTGAEGSYVVTVEARGAGHVQLGQATLDLPYSDEYRSFGTSMPFLQQLANLGGGGILQSTDAAWADNLAPVIDRRDLSQALWILTILLLPLDIGIRRLHLQRTDLTALREGLHVRSRRKRVRPQREPAPAAASHLSVAPRQPVAMAASRVPPQSVHVVRKPATPPPQSEVAPASSSTRPRGAMAPAESTVSQLLATKRKRQ